MKKYVLISLLIVALFPAVARPSFASDSYLNIIGGVGAGYYYLYPKDLQIKDLYRGGMAYRGFLEFKAESGLSAIGDITYYSEGNRYPLAPYGTTLTIIPVTASVAYHLFKDSSLSPYLGAGIGIYNIKDSDPDLTYLYTTKFGKHLFVGADFYFDRSTILRAELRQSFIDPVNSLFYYQASLGGLTATLNIAIEWPLPGRGAPMTSEEAAAEQQRSFAYDEHRAIMYRLNEIDSYYDQQNWNRTIYYQPWNTPDIYINTVLQPTQQQIDEQKSRAEQYKLEQDQKRQDYIEQKLQLRQEKKELVNPAR